MLKETIENKLNRLDKLQEDFKLSLVSDWQDLYNKIIMPDNKLYERPIKVLNTHN